MAWRSSGANNDELVNNLKRFGVISSSTVEAAFRNVDRIFFVPKNRREMAHTDQPLKEGNVHISAPHIYGTVLEALDLSANSSMTFLNAGSGTCYLSCLCAAIMGKRSTVICIEIHDDVVEHSKNSVASWKQQLPTGSGPYNIDIIKGNALHISLDEGECARSLFDRIYVGASIEKSDLPRFRQLLKPGGILVGPVEDELVKVVRGYGQLVEPDTAPRPQFSQEVISPVRFSPLLSYPALDTVIPARIWHPSISWLYPDNFRKSCRVLMLCSSARFEQPFCLEQRHQVNVASLLPRALWLEILSYTHRDWFEAPRPEIESLRQRLAEAQAKLKTAEEARLQAEARRKRAEAERDMYKLIARGWRDGLTSTHNQENNGDIAAVSTEEAAASTLIPVTQGNRTMIGLGHLLCRLGRDSTVFSNSSNCDASSQEEGDRMEEEEEEGEDMLIETYNAVTDASSARQNQRSNSSTELSSTVISTNLLDSAKAITERSQVMAVSISNVDL